MFSFTFRSYEQKSCLTRDRRRGSVEGTRHSNELINRMKIQTLTGITGVLFYSIIPLELRAPVLGNK